MLKLWNTLLCWIGAKETLTITSTLLSLLLPIPGAKKTHRQNSYIYDKTLFNLIQLSLELNPT